MELKLQVLADVVMDEEAVKKALALMSSEELEYFFNLVLNEAVNRAEALSH